MLAPTSPDERAIVHLLRGLRGYDKLLGTSACSGRRANLAQGMSEIAGGLLKLIDGPCGRLDAELLAREIAPYLYDFQSEGGLSVVVPQPETAAGG